MRRIARNLLESVYFILCFAAVPLLIGYMLTGNGVPLVIACAAVMPLAFLISLLPGKVGQKARAEVFVERRAHSSDPDPDRRLRSDTHDDTAREKRGFPLRLAVCLGAMAVIFVFLLVGPVDLNVYNPMDENLDLLNRSVPWVNTLTRVVVSLVPVIMLALGLRFAVTGASMGTSSSSVGVILYVIAGVAAHFVRSETLIRALAVSGGLYLVVMLLAMNSHAMYIGSSSREGVRPPSALRRSNRALMVMLIGLGTLLVFRSWLREKLLELWAVVRGALGRFIEWLMSRGGDQAIQQGQPGGGMGDLAGLAGDAEPSPFWEAMTYVAYALAAVVAVFLLYWFIRRVVKLVITLAKRLRAWLDRFAQGVGEEYRDEQESLIDWDESRKALTENVKKRLSSLFKRERRWEEMNPRERARHLVNTLYRREKIRPDSATLRETLPRLKTASADALADCYEVARYADRDPDGAALEALRKDIRV